MLAIFSILPIAITFSRLSAAAAADDSERLNSWKGILILNAIKNENPDEAVRLLSSELTDADVNVRDDEEGFEGMSPLLLALKFKYEDVALMLIESNADVNAMEPSSQDTSLHVAVKRSMKRSVRALIQRGAILEARNAAKMTPLLTAAVATSRSSSHATDVVKILLDAGADANASVRVEGIPITKPLYHAAENENGPVAELLLLRGAYVDEVYKWRGFWTPLDITLRVREYSPRQKECLIVLLNNGAGQTCKNTFGNIVKSFWHSEYVLSRIKSYRNFDDCFLKITGIRKALTPAEVNAAAVTGIRNIIASVPKLGDVVVTKLMREGKVKYLVTKYDEEGMFALYRLLKWGYVGTRWERMSFLEGKKWDIFRYVMSKMLEKTYLGKLPVDVAADTLYEAGYYGWKLERLAFNVALVTYELRVGVSEDVKNIAYDLFWEGELETS